MNPGTRFKYKGLDGIHYYTGYYLGLDEAGQHEFWYDNYKQVLHIPVEYWHLMNL